MSLSLKSARHLRGVARVDDPSLPSMIYQDAKEARSLIKNLLDELRF
jgi:hypothetical protein